MTSGDRQPATLATVGWRGQRSRFGDRLGCQPVDARAEGCWVRRMAFRQVIFTGGCLETQIETREAAE
jgi:hypothetical protein